MYHQHKRLRRESITIQKMILLYCHENHGTQNDQLCSECHELWHYSEERLQRCPFQERKSTCAKCTIHCYKPAMRVKTRQMMKSAGPKMILRHPILAVFHMLDGLKPAPTLPRNLNTQSKKESNDVRPT